MTKQQAREKAEIEFHTTGRDIFLDDLAMEIYAAAFAEWTENNNYAKIKNGNWADIWQIDLKEYTRAELLIEFEKNK